MPRYLYVFSYRTPIQEATSQETGPSEEASEALFIEAADASQALDWGREVSEAYVQKLFGNQQLSWKSQGFSHWVESEPHKEYPADVLAHLPCVACREFPDFSRFGR
jgi:hypothetical protein